MPQTKAHKLVEIIQIYYAVSTLVKASGFYPAVVRKLCLTSATLFEEIKAEVRRTEGAMYMDDDTYRAANQHNSWTHGLTKQYREEYAKSVEGFG